MVLKREAIEERLKELDKVLQELISTATCPGRGLKPISASSGSSNEA
jgi:hypothetical protein